MPVAFDAVGPSSSGANSATASLTWAHTITGSGTVLLAACALDAGSDGAFSMSATYNAVAMTSLSVVHSGGLSAGFLQVWGIIAAAGAAHNVVVTAAGGTPSGLSGGSLSFTGAGQSIAAAFGTPATGTGNPASTVTATMASTTSGNIIGGFACSGSSFSSATSPSTSRFIGGSGFSAAAGQSAGATSPSTGSPVTMAWTLGGSDAFAEIMIEVLAAASGANPPAGLATGTGTALNAAIQTSNVNVGPNYAGAAADLGGVYGSWATPQYATGGP
jgi:hypothetical protein